MLTKEDEQSASFQGATRPAIAVLTSRLISCIERNFKTCYSFNLLPPEHSDVGRILVIEGFQMLRHRREIRFFWAYSFHEVEGRA